MRRRYIEPDFEQILADPDYSIFKKEGPFGSARLTQYAVQFKDRRRDGYVHTITQPFRHNALFLEPEAAKRNIADNVKMTRISEFYPYSLDDDEATRENTNMGVARTIIHDIINDGPKQNAAVIMTITPHARMQRVLRDNGFSYPLNISDTVMARWL